MQTEYLHDHNYTKYKSVFRGLLTMYHEVLMCVIFRKDSLLFTKDWELQY